MAIVLRLPEYHAGGVESAFQLAPEPKPSDVLWVKLDNELGAHHRVGDWGVSGTARGPRLSPCVARPPQRNHLWRARCRPLSARRRHPLDTIPGRLVRARADQDCIE